MVVFNFSPLCKEARLYYYDFLCKKGREPIPESVISHIEQCQHCQGQLSQLTRVLSIAEGYAGSEQGQIDSDIAIVLKLHLAYIGKTVTCETIKPFLPSLLDPTSEIGIPTPITVHLDNCQKCFEDLEAIRKLNLNHKQLRRLSRLFADKPAESNVSCTEAQNAIPSLVSIVLGEVDSEVLRHLCVCPDCRGLLYQRREMVIKGLYKTKLVEKKFSCKKVSVRDFFDYVVPYGLDQVNDRHAEFRESLMSHLRTCPICLAKMQELHETIYEICERTDSDVVTIYRIDETAKARILEQPDAPYAGFPIRVDVRKQEKAEVEAESLLPAVGSGTALKQKKSRVKLRPLVKTALAAAAVVAIAAGLLLNTPTAKAVTLERIYQAFEKIKNVHIASFTPTSTEPSQELWISKTLNVYAIKTAKQYVLWDMANRIRKTKQPDGGTTDTGGLTDEAVAGIEENMDKVSGIMPFNSVSDIPPDAGWSRVDDTSTDTVNGIEVYDLTWSKKAYDGSVEFRKWRVYADSETNLPRKVEWYRISAADGEYILSSTMVVEYVSESEVRKIIF